MARLTSTNRWARYTGETSSSTRAERTSRANGLAGEVARLGQLLKEARGETAARDTLIDDLEKARLDLKRQLKLTTDSRRAAEAEQRRLDGRKKQLERIATSLRSSHRMEKIKLVAARDEAITKSSAAATRIADAEARIADTEARRAEMEARSRRFATERAELMNRVADHENAMSEASDLIKHLKSQLADHVLHSETREVEIRGLERAHRKLETRVAELEARLAEQTAATEAASKKWVDAREGLEESLRKLGAARTKQELGRKRVAGLEAGLEEAHRTLVESRERWRQRQARERRLLEEQSAKREAELRKALAEEAEGREATMLASLTSEAESRERRHGREIRQARASLRDREKTLRKTTSKLKVALGDLSSTRRRVEALEKQSADLMRELKKTRSRLKETRDARDAAHRKAEAAAETSRVLRVRSRDLDRSVHELTRDREGMFREYVRARQDRRDLEAKLTERTTEAEELGRRLVLAGQEKARARGRARRHQGSPGERLRRARSPERLSGSPPPSGLSRSRRRRPRSGDRRSSPSRPRPLPRHPGRPSPARAA